MNRRNTIHRLNVLCDTHLADKCKKAKVSYLNMHAEVCPRKAEECYERSRGDMKCCGRDSKSTRLRIQVGALPLYQPARLKQPRIQNTLKYRESVIVFI
jgi:hypothetical protein